MTNQNVRDIKDLFNKTAYDVNGDKLGSVKEVFVDDNSGQPTFVEVSHGLFGMSESIVPMRGHKFAGEDDLILAFDKERIKDAPSVDTDKALSANDQNEIFRHYGVDTMKDEQAYTGGRHDVSDKNKAGLAAGAGAGAGVGAAAGAEYKEHAHEDHVAGTETHVAGTETADHTKNAGHTHADVDGRDSLVRSEEQMDVNKERVETGEVRLRKYVVTETENVEVPVTREEVRVERTPISEEEAASLRGKNDLTDDEASVTLHEERVRVEKDTVPVEKVELNKKEVTDTERVSEDLRKERIETEGVDGKTTK